MNKYVSLISWAHLKFSPLFAIPVLLLDLEKDKELIALSFVIFITGIFRLYELSKKGENK